METGTSRTSLIRIVVFVILGVGVGCLIYYSPNFFAKPEKETAPHLKTGGTSSVAIMVDGWKPRYLADKGVEVDYDNSGSTAGVNNVIERKYAIGFTHAPLSEEQRKKAQATGGEMIQIPVVICAVAPVYNLKELKKEDVFSSSFESLTTLLNEERQLNFTGDVLGKIFVGEITKWNDDAIKKLNPKVADRLPDKTIEVVHRKDSSGTTFIFSEYLHQTSDRWREKMGEPKSEYKDDHKWPVGVAKERSIGVAEYILTTEGTIGYVEMARVYVGGGELRSGKVQNKNQNAFLPGEPKFMAAAAKSLSAGDIKDDLTLSLTNRPGDDSYPICGTIWAVCYRDQPAATYKMVADFLDWVTHEKDQKISDKRKYAPLPEELRTRAEAKLKTLKSAS